MADYNLSVAAAGLNTAITKANAAAPQSTTYTKTEVNALTGNLTQLSTTDKTSLVAAINELAAAIQAMQT